MNIVILLLISLKELYNLLKYLFVYFIYLLNKYQMKNMQ